MGLNWGGAKRLWKKCRRWVPPYTFYYLATTIGDKLEDLGEPKFRAWLRRKGDKFLNTCDVAVLAAVAVATTVATGGLATGIVAAAAAAGTTVSLTAATSTAIILVGLTKELLEIEQTDSEKEEVEKAKKDLAGEALSSDTGIEVMNFIEKLEKEKDEIELVFKDTVAEIDIFKEKAIANATRTVTEINTTNLDYEKYLSQADYKKYLNLKDVEKTAQKQIADKEKAIKTQLDSEEEIIADIMDTPEIDKLLTKKPTPFTRGMTKIISKNDGVMTQKELDIYFKHREKIKKVLGHYELIRNYYNKEQISDDDISVLKFYDKETNLAIAYGSNGNPVNLGHALMTSSQWKNYVEEKLKKHNLIRTYKGKRVTNEDIVNIIKNDLSKLRYSHYLPLRAYLFDVNLEIFRFMFSSNCVFGFEYLLNNATHFNISKARILDVMILDKYNKIQHVSLKFRQNLLKSQGFKLDILNVNLPYSIVSKCFIQGKDIYDKYNKFQVDVPAIIKKYKGKYSLLASKLPYHLVIDLKNLAVSGQEGAVYKILGTSYVHNERAIEKEQRRRRAMNIIVLRKKHQLDTVKEEKKKSFFGLVQEGKDSQQIFILGIEQNNTNILIEVTTITILFVTAILFILKHK